MTVEQFWSDEDIKVIYEDIKGKNLRVVLPEGEDDRVIDALSYLRDIRVVLIGNKEVIDKKVEIRYEDQAADIKRLYEVIEGKDFVQEDLIDVFVEKRNGKTTREEATELIKEANYFSTVLLEAGKVDALVGGCVYSTADILKPAFQIIKPAPGNSVVSSSFLMKKDGHKMIFADCAVNVNPTAAQIKEITLQTIKTAREMGVDPKVAMLSYSTKGSGFGEYVDIVVDAYNQLIEEHPHLIDIVDGELQFDAAFVPKTGKMKAPTSPVAGIANVFIFPHILAGNIAYKMVQTLGGYEAVGPTLQGLNKPVNDLSRGADAPTIAKVMYLALRSYR